MYYPMFYFDPTYIFVLIGLIICLAASAKMRSTFSKYSRVRNHWGMTGREAAEQVLHRAGIYDVRVEHISGNLTDHYDPRSNVIRLSDSVYDSTSIAAVGVAAHEAGHAVQYAQDYGPIKLRGAIIPVCNFSSQISILLIILGFVLYSRPLFAVGVILFAVATVFQVVTLPVEFNASRRAIRSLRDTNLLDEQELRGAKKVLGAAAMTYVAALLVSIAHLLRYLLLFGSRRRD